ncbi:MAG: VCBS repeat-containing protein [Planctomycetes bacterium]|nr:VCBS repeat-containing protein [Planctomycetota bacterium]
MPTPDAVHVNLGGERFARSYLALPTVAESSTSFALRDIDRDGDLDLLIGTSRMGTWLHRNDRGRFTRLPLGTIAAPNYPDNTRHVAFADIDGDGWLDIAVANADASFRFYRCASPSPT